MMTTTLVFENTAEQALRFYAEVFGYTITATDLYPWGEGREGLGHGEISIYNRRLMFTDNNQPHKGFAGFSLSINLTDKAVMTKHFTDLSVNATDIMPLQKVDWSDYYGELTDQFGVRWSFNLD